MVLTMTATFNVFAKTTVRQQRIPFEISMDVPKADTLEEVEQMKKNPADEVKTKLTLGGLSNLENKNSLTPCSEYQLTTLSVKCRYCPFI